MENFSKNVNEKYLRDLSKSKNEPEWMLKKRLEALNKFFELTMPNFKYGMNIKLKYDFDFDKIDFDSNNSQIELASVNKVIFDTFENVLNSEKQIVRDHFMKLIDNDNKFIALNSALFDKGILIYVPKNIKVKDSVMLSSLQSSKSFMKYILIILDENSRLNFIDDISSDYKEEHYSSNVIEIFLKENAKLNYIKIQNLSLNAYNFDHKKAKIEKNAELSLYDLNFGSKLTYSNTTANLDGENSKFESYNLFLGSMNQQFDLGLEAIHNYPYTYSNMLSRGALNNESKAIYRGLIKINKNAANSNGYQKEETILLSEKSESDSIPKLEIENSEVKCSHGASISHIDEDKLFYLMSRGLEEKEAKQELVKGFFEIILSKIKLDNLEKIQAIIEEKIK